MERKLNIKYSILYAVNSALVASMLAFAAIYLMEKGFANSNIGIILALCSVSSILIQTFFANFTVKFPNFRLQDIITGNLGVVILASLALIFIPSPLLFMGTIILAFSFAQSLTPFLNSLAFIYEDQNVHINYGVGRGFGSLSYAIITLILGYAIEATSANILPFVYIAMAILFIFMVRSYRLDQDPLGEMDPFVEVESNVVKQEKSILEKTAKVASVPVEQQSLAGFLTKYRYLFLVIIGLAITLFGQSMVNTFMIHVVTPLGGDSSTVGVAVFLAAVVEVPVMMNFDKLMKRRSAGFWLKVAMIFYVLKISLLYFATSLWMVYLSQILQFGSYALAYPAAVQYVKGAVEKKDLFKGQTFFTINTTLSSVFASFCGGILFDRVGTSRTIFVGAIAAVIGLIIIYSAVDKAEVPATQAVPVK